jgi:hypothetical protein
VLRDVQPHAHVSFALEINAHDQGWFDGCPLLPTEWLLKRLKGETELQTKWKLSVR